MSTSTLVTLAPPAGPDDHTRGSSHALVTLVEYGDFQCPYCGAAYPIVQQLEQEAGGLLRVIFRNFPLSSLHANAEIAAEAAEAAAAQGRFWEMHDLLFENQRRLGAEALEGYARQAGVADLERFLTELEIRRWQPRVREHFRSGAKSGVNGTPTFFINGIRHDGGYGFEELLAAIQRAAGEATREREA